MFEIDRVIMLKVNITVQTREKSSNIMEQIKDLFIYKNIT